MTEFLVKLFVKNSADTTDPAVRERYGVFAGIVCIISNLLLSAAKFLIGTLSGSIAIQVDAVNNLSDVGSSAVMIFGAKASNKPADGEHPYGHARLEYVIALGIAFIILLVGVSLLKESVMKILSPEPVDYSLAAIIVLAGSILTKLWMGAFTSNIGRRIDSDTMSAASKDSLSDVAATGAILIACVAGLLWKENIDGYVGIVASGFVLYSGVSIIRDTIGPLLGEAPDSKTIDELSERILSYEGIIGLHDIMLHNYGPNNTIATAHAEVRSDSDLLAIHETIDRIEREVFSDMGIMLTIHLDPIEVDNTELNRARSVIDGLISNISGIVSIHDFRMVNGQNNINLIFDVVVAPGTTGKDESRIRNELTEGVHKVNKIYTLVMKFDFDYT